jgi:hypothetical protein
VKFKHFDRSALESALPLLRVRKKMLITSIIDGSGRLTWLASVLHVVGCILLLFSTNNLLAQDQSHRYADGEPAPTLVLGFVGGFVRSNDLRRSEVQLVRHFRAEYGVLWKSGSSKIAREPRLARRPPLVQWHGH